MKRHIGRSLSRRTLIHYQLIVRWTQAAGEEGLPCYHMGSTALSQGPGHLEDAVK